METLNVQDPKFVEKATQAASTLDQQINALRRENSEFDMQIEQARSRLREEQHAKMQLAYQTQYNQKKILERLNEVRDHRAQPFALQTPRMSVKPAQPKPLPQPPIERGPPSRQNSATTLQKEASSSKEDLFQSRARGATISATINLIVYYYEKWMVLSLNPDATVEDNTKIAMAAFNVGSSSAESEGGSFFGALPSGPTQFGLWLPFPANCWLKTSEKLSKYNLKDGVRFSLTFLPNLYFSKNLN